MCGCRFSHGKRAFNVPPIAKRGWPPLLPVNVKIRERRCNRTVRTIVFSRMNCRCCAGRIHKVMVVQYPRIHKAAFDDLSTFFVKNDPQAVGMSNLLSLCIPEDVYAWDEQMPRRKRKGFNIDFIAAHGHLFHVHCPLNRIHAIPCSFIFLMPAPSRLLWAPAMSCIACMTALERQKEKYRNRMSVFPTVPHKFSS